MDYKHLTRCRACGSHNLQDYFDLGFQPLANKLLNSKQELVNKYKLSVLYCHECSLSQLSLVVNPQVLYSDYPYMSSISKTFSKHCYDMAMRLRRHTWNRRPRVLDIASNDGCLLLEFATAGYDVMGVEPCKALAEVANKGGINTVNAFWSSETAKLFKNMDFITATNVFAHVDDWDDFLDGVCLSLSLNGTFVLEFPHAMNLINGVQFDTIYHEHLAYLLLRPLMKKFELHGLKIFHVEKLPIHGGTLRVYASKKNKWVMPSVYMLQAEEMINGMYEIDAYCKFAHRASCAIEDLSCFLDDHKGDVVGLCASAKATVLLNACGADDTLIPYIVDDTPTKQGKFIPGCGIPIVPMSDIGKPKYLLLLAWNFKKELMDKTKHLGCQYVVPIPSVSVE